MKYIYLIIFQGGHSHLINVIRTREDKVNLYAQASRHTYEDQEIARDVAAKLAKDNYLSYMTGDGTIIEYKFNHDKYLD